MCWLVVIPTLSFRIHGEASIMGGDQSVVAGRRAACYPRGRAGKSRRATDSRNSKINTVVNRIVTMGFRPP